MDVMDPYNLSPPRVSLIMHLILLVGLTWVGGFSKSLFNDHSLFQVIALTLFGFTLGRFCAKRFFLRKNLLLPGDMWNSEWLIEKSPDKNELSSTFLVFLNPECASCKRWISLLNVMASLSRDVEIVGILPASLEDVKLFKEKFSVKFNLKLMKEEQFYSSISETPTALKVEKNKIISRWVGEVPRELENEFSGIYEKITVAN